MTEGGRHDWRREVRKRLPRGALDPAREVDVVQELAQHLDDRYEELRAAGASDEEAAAAALDELRVLAYLVSQRTQEIGIRLALGALPRDVFRLVVGRGLLLTLAGAACGLAGAFWLAPSLETFLYQVEATDPMTFAGAPLLLVAVALA